MTTKRNSPIEMNKEEFKQIGYRLIDQIAGFIDNIEDRPVTTGESARQLAQHLGKSTLPEDGTPASELLSRASELMLNHSLLNGHPRFFGYITSSAAPIGALADLLAASVNPNVGAQVLSPMATEIEKQTVRWLAELIGLSPTYGGVLVSGGNMANFTAFLAGRTAKAPKNIKEDGIFNETRLVIYCSKTTHTWVEKAAILFGLGSKAIRWIETDDANKINTGILEKTIRDDIEKGFKPIMIIGTAGDVSTGAVDDLRALGSISKTYDLWFHIDGAYGIPAAVIPGLREVFKGIEEADSIALDPHKWLYSPLEAGCTLVKNPNHLLETFSSHPVYYKFSNSDADLTHNYYEYGLQNSRGFRALKVWLSLQQVGKNGYIQMINEDIRLSKLMFTYAQDHPELEAITQNLSIATFRYVPAGYENAGAPGESYLNSLNETLLNELQLGGEVFLSNALVKDKFCLRACIVNFRTAEQDIKVTIETIVREGRKLHRSIQEKEKAVGIKQDQV